MLGSFLVLLREGFEATLLVAIVLAYLARIGRKDDFRQVWIGVGLAVLASVVVGGALFATAGSLSGTAGAVFKASTMWLAVAFLTYMVLWMRRESKNAGRNIRSGVDAAISGGSSLAIAGMVFVMSFREGIETALFMFGVSQSSTPFGVVVGGALGVVGAVALGYLVYAAGRRIDLGVFFKVTGALLILVAAGLLARGVAILEVEGLIPAIIYPLWDATGTFVLTTQSVVGQFLSAFTGWDPKPDALQFGVWLVYVALIGFAFLRPQGKAPARRTGAVETAETAGG